MLYHLTPKQNVEVARLSIAVLVNLATGFFVYAATLPEAPDSHWQVIITIFASLATLVGAYVVATSIGDE